LFGQTTCCSCFLFVVKIKENKQETSFQTINNNLCAVSYYCFGWSCFLFVSFIINKDGSVVVVVISQDGVLFHHD